MCANAEASHFRLTSTVIVVAFGVTVTVAFASQLQLGLFSELIPLIVAPPAASGTISVTLVAPMVFGIDSPSAISFPLRWTS